MTPYLEYSEAEHRYFADGRELMSVTQILDADGRISQFCRDEEARERGTKVHELCAIDDVSPLDMRKVPAHLRGYLKAWRKYRAVTGFEPTLIEHRIDCLQYGYAGRFDRLGVLPDQTLPVMLDIKTSKSGAIPDYARLQLVAYGHALDEKKIFLRIAVSLRPNGTYNTKPYTFATYQQDRAEWLDTVLRIRETKDGHSNSERN